MIEVQSLTQRYGAFTALRELSFSVAAGEVVGFLGPNGAGKTTTLKVLASYLQPSEGKVRVGGFDARLESFALRQKLGYLPEHCPLYDEMPVEDFLLFVARVRALAKGQRANAVGRAVEACGLREVLRRELGELSKGYRQRVGLAQAILHEPDVLLLDEPTSGLDPEQLQDIRALVRRLGEERTVLFSSHVLADVEATCQRALIIRQGRLVADGSLSELKQAVRGGAQRVRFRECPPDIAAQLTALEGVARVDPSNSEAGTYLVHPEERADDLPGRLFHFARDRELTLTYLAPLEVSLEEVFAHYTQSGAAE